MGRNRTMIKKISGPKKDELSKKFRILQKESFIIYTDHLIMLGQ
jgi:hypothetical protein